MVQAWATIDPDYALRQARELDRGPSRGALHGVPIGVKDIIDTADLPTEMGSPIYEGNRSFSDAACVALVRAAGAVILGKTVTAEFAGMSPGPDHQSAQSGAHAGRLVERLGRRRRRSHGAGGVRHADRRLGAAARRLLRRGRLQADLQSDQPGRHQVRGRDARHHRADRPHGRRRRADHRRAHWQGAGQPHARRERRGIGLCRTPLWDTAAAGNEGRRSRTRRSGSPRPARRCARSRCRRNSRGSITRRARPSTITNARSPWPPTGRATASASARCWATASSSAWRCKHEDYVAALQLAEHCRALIAKAFDGIDAILAPCVKGEAPLGLGHTGDPGFPAVLDRPLCAEPSSLPTHRGPTGLPVGIQLVAPRYADDSLFACARWIWQRLGRA